MIIAKTAGGDDHDGRPQRPLRIAIVGLGPKGLYCLESLIRQHKLRHYGRLLIYCFEPANLVGAGNVYCIDQPSYLRMNFATKNINAWVDSDSGEGNNLSLCDWLKVHFPDSANPDRFIARSIVGRYLHDCFQTATVDLPESIEVRIIQDHVDSIRPLSESTWQIVRRRDTAAVSCIFDEVLVTTGHGGWRRPSKSMDDVDRVFPVTTQLDACVIPAKSAVAIRGFSLTWIDAVLALTEGRGGRFETDDQAAFCLKYVESGNEPRVIAPFSRSGRPMLSKPDHERLRVPETLNAIWSDSLSELQSLAASSGQVSFTREIWPVIISAAKQAFAAASKNAAGSADDQNVEQWIRHWFDSGGGDCNWVMDQMRQSADVAQGIAPLNEAWALGETWRRLYSGLVQCISHDGLAGGDWSEYRRTAAEMERIAFGPPVTNVRKILSLVDSRLICLDFLTGKLQRDPAGAKLESGSRTLAVDTVINATIPAASDHDPNSPVGQLLSTKHLSQSEIHGGINISQSGEAISSPGNVVSGLSVIGRPTEGCVLGNDTLSRKLHSHPEKWGIRIAEKALSHCER